MAGAVTFLALNSAKGFEIVAHQVRSTVDEKDSVGPAAIEDMERVHRAAPAALVFEGGRRMAVRRCRKEQGRISRWSIARCTAFSTFDTVSLHAATGAPDIRFDL